MSPPSPFWINFSLSSWTKYAKKFLTVSLKIVIENVFRQQWYGSIKKHRQQRVETYLQFDTRVYRGFNFVLVKTFQLFLSSPLSSSVTFLVRHRSGIIVLSSFVRLFTVLTFTFVTTPRPTWLENWYENEFVVGGWTLLAYFPPLCSSTIGSIHSN